MYEEEKEMIVLPCLNQGCFDCLEQKKMKFITHDIIPILLICLLAIDVKGLRNIFQS